MRRPRARAARPPRRRRCARRGTPVRGGRRHGRGTRHAAPTRWRCAPGRRPHALRPGRSSRVAATRAPRARRPASATAARLAARGRRCRQSSAVATEQLRSRRDCAASASALGGRLDATASCSSRTAGTGGPRWRHGSRHRPARHGRRGGRQQCPVPGAGHRRQQAHRQHGLGHRRDHTPAFGESAASAASAPAERPTAQAQSRGIGPSRGRAGRASRVLEFPVLHSAGSVTRSPATAVAVIPARFSSTRLPGKPLADIHGRPMIEHVYRRACEAHDGRRA